MKTIALTGSIGAGKSSVLKMLADMNILTISADQINHELLQKNAEGYRNVVAVFSSDILDANKEIDKQKLAQVIFSNNTNRQKLEEIMHPLILKTIQNKINASHEAKIVIVEVPLLFESKWDRYFDECWVVVSKDELRLARLLNDRHMKEQDAKQRMKAQMSQEEKMVKADQIIYNDHGKKELKQQIQLLLEEFI